MRQCKMNTSGLLQLRPVTPQLLPKILTSLYNTYIKKIKNWHCNCPGKNVKIIGYERLRYNS